MENIKVYKPPGGVSQVETFIEGLEPKLRDKLVWQIFRLSRTPPAGLKEPHYKHFSIEKYRDLYELREKNHIVIRVIFTVLPNGEVLLLHAFQKRQSRDTMQALERSLKLLSLLREHPEHAVEYTVPIAKATAEGSESHSDVKGKGE